MTFLLSLSSEADWVVEDSEAEDLEGIAEVSSNGDEEGREKKRRD